jgi:glycine cleavage system regulatory protein
MFRGTKTRLSSLRLEEGTLHATFVFVGEDHRVHGRMNHRLPAEGLPENLQKAFQQFVDELNAWGHTQHFTDSLKEKGLNVENIVSQLRTNDEADGSVEQG